MQTMLQTISGPVLGTPDPGQGTGVPAPSVAPPQPQVTATGPGTSPAAAQVFDHYADTKPASGPPTAAPTKDALEELVTLYHISSAPGWADKIAAAKAGGKTFDDLGGAKINPGLTKAYRTEAEPMGDGRGGDDLGPGFYTGDSAAFVEKYGKENFAENPGAVMQFQLTKRALAGLKADHHAPDDAATFQQFMTDGFATKDDASGKVSRPKLDTAAPTHDLVSGPINDIKKSQFVSDGTTTHNQGSILKLGDETPLQYNFTTDRGVRTLYEGAQSITSTPMKQWLEDRAKPAAAGGTT